MQAGCGARSQHGHSGGPRYEPALAASHRPASPSEPPSCAPSLFSALTPPLTSLVRVPTPRFLHPLHNFALVSYDPRELPPQARKSIRAAELCTEPLQRGDTVILAGVTRCLRLMLRKSVVTNSTLALTLPPADVPRCGRPVVHEKLDAADSCSTSR